MVVSLRFALINGIKCSDSFVVVMCIFRWQSLIHRRNYLYSCLLCCVWFFILSIHIIILIGFLLETSNLLKTHLKTKCTSRWGKRYIVFFLVIFFFYFANGNHIHQIKCISDSLQLIFYVNSVCLFVCYCGMNKM